MWPIFANPAGFWALLAVPALLAIHFLQQRARIAVTSTLFLLETLTPESRGGRVWERLRGSRALWLQLLAVLLATWVLAEPRWLRGESAQTVVAVLDSSVSMSPFQSEARRAAAARLAASAGRAARTTWIVMTSDPRQPPLYRGDELAAAVRALEAWRPALGTHDATPALTLARSLAGGRGLTWFVTDSRTKASPDQPAVGVGRPLANVGFAGASVSRVQSGVDQWKALVKNHADHAQTRTWWIERPADEPGATPVRSAPQTVELPAGGLVEISARIPERADAITVVLAADEFAVDDRLPLVRPERKRLPVAITLDGDAGEFFRRLCATVDGVTLAPPAGARLRVARFAETPGAAILLAPEAAEGSERKLQRAPVVAEKHPLVAELNWQALLGSGVASLSRAPGDEALLWQADAPLVWLRSGADDVRQLVLNFTWSTTNADRLPATVLLLRRFIETVRDAQAGTWAANFDAGAPVALTSRDLVGAGELTLVEGGRARAIAATERAVLRAPLEPGFFEVRRDGEVLVRGAAQFADARQGDFRKAENFETPPTESARAVIERNTRPDPFVMVWLALMGLALTWSWWPARAVAARTAPAGGRP